jgi:hypothetical protein
MEQLKGEINQLREVIKPLQAELALTRRQYLALKQYRDKASKGQK